MNSTFVGSVTRQPARLHRHHGSAREQSVTGRTRRSCQAAVPTPRPEAAARRSRGSHRRSSPRDHGSPQCSVRRPGRETTAMGRARYGRRSRHRRSSRPWLPTPSRGHSGVDRRIASFVVDGCDTARASSSAIVTPSTPRRSMPSSPPRAPGSSRPQSAQSGRTPSASA